MHEGLGGPAPVFRHSTPDKEDIRCIAQNGDVSTEEGGELKKNAIICTEWWTLNSRERRIGIPIQQFANIMSVWWKKREDDILPRIHIAGLPPDIPRKVIWSFILYKIAFKEFAAIYLRNGDEFSTFFPPRFYILRCRRFWHLSLRGFPREGVLTLVVFSPEGVPTSETPPLYRFHERTFHQRCLLS